MWRQRSRKLLGTLAADGHEKRIAGSLRVSNRLDRNCNPHAGFAQHVQCIEAEFLDASTQQVIDARLRYAEYLGRLALRGALGNVEEGSVCLSREHD